MDNIILPALLAGCNNHAAHSFYFVDSVTGSGKTRAATDFAMPVPLNFCFVMPTKRLVQNTVADLLNRKHPGRTALSA